MDPTVTAPANPLVSTARRIRHYILLQYRTQLLWLITSACISVAIVAGYVRYIFIFSANGVYWDEWNWIDLMRRGQTGTLTLGDLWAQHNEARMFFPNLIALGIGNLTRYNEMAFVLLGCLFLLGAVIFLTVACRDEFSQHPVWYIPGLLIMFSLAQYENILWSFQFAWFLIVCCVGGVLLLLTSPRVSGWRFGLAVLFGVVASYSLFQGLLIWGAGLVALLRPGVSMRLRAAWLAVGIAVTAFYFYGLNLTNLGGPPLSQFPSHLPSAIAGFFVAIGSIVPDIWLISPGEQHFSMTMLLGGLITLAGLFVLVSWAYNHRTDRTLTVAAGLVVLGFLFDLSLMPDRLSAGAINGTVSRYTTFNLLLLAGAYVGSIRTLSMAIPSGSAKQLVASGVAAGLIATLAAIQIPIATRAGNIGGLRTFSSHAEAANLTANFDTAPSSLIEIYGYPPSDAYFRSLAAYLESQRWNVFSDDEYLRYRATGVVAGGVVTSILPFPAEFGEVTPDTPKWRAWLALCSVYQQRVDLQRAFPGNTVETSRQMVAWVVHSGMDSSDVGYAPVLLPYASQYIAWFSQEQTQP